MQKTIKVKDWIAFNKDYYDSGYSEYPKDVVVRLFDTETLNSDNIALETTIDLKTCEELFGDFELAKFQVRRSSKSYNDHIVALLIWKPRT